jgi:hypothetical protein
MRVIYLGLPIVDVIALVSYGLTITIIPDIAPVLIKIAINPVAVHY